MDIPLDVTYASIDQPERTSLLIGQSETLEALITPSGEHFIYYVYVFYVYKIYNTLIFSCRKHGRN